MKVCIVATGSMGTFYPCFLLAKHLQQRGHDVSLFGCNDFAKHAEGVPYFPDGHNIQNWLLGKDPKGNCLEYSIFGDLKPEGYDNLMHATQGVDVIVTTAWYAALALCVSRELKIPLIGLGLFPTFFTPSEKYNKLLDNRAYTLGPVFDFCNITGWFHWNRFLHENILSHTSDSLISQWYKYYNDSNVTCTQSLALFSKNKIPTMYAINKHICSFADDWDPSIVSFCGDVGSKVNFDLNNDVDMFLSAGEPPVYIGFGSMALTDIIWDIIRYIVSNNKRVLFCSGWTDLECPQDILQYTKEQKLYICDKLNHAHVFPKCYLIVHHGGCGTTHAACASGTPAIIMPVAIDQFYWGDSVQEKNVGLNGGFLYSNKSLQSFKKCFEDISSTYSTYKMNSHNLSIMMHDTNALDNMVKFIETNSSTHVIHMTRPYVYRIVCRLTVKTIDCIEYVCNKIKI